MQPELARLATRVDGRLRELVDRQPVRDFYDLARYEFGWQAQAGDDLIRPHFAAVLCLACCQAAGGRVEAALPLAMAIDLLHHFVLVEEDLEQERRQRDGRATLGACWGRAQAMNAGDGLHALAKMALLYARDDLPASTILALEEALDECCLSLCEATQQLLAGSAPAEALRQRLLYGCAAAAGAGLAGASDDLVARFRAFGEDLDAGPPASLARDADAMALLTNLTSYRSEP